MPAASEPTFPATTPRSGQNTKASLKSNFKPETRPLDSQGLFTSDMAAAASPGPYIKDEPDDLQFNSSRIMAPGGFDMSPSFGGQPFSSNQGESVNPSDIMNGGFMNNPFGSQNMSSSFIMGNSNIADDELLDLGNIDDRAAQQGFASEHNGFGDQQGSTNPGQNGYFHNSVSGGPVSMSQQGQSSHAFSHTPEGAPIQSPFTHDFNYNQFRPVSQQHQGYNPNMPSPAGMQNGTFDARSRPKMHPLERQDSDSRSPMTPKTPGIGAFNIGTPDSGSFPPHMMGNQYTHRHQKSSSGQWDNTPGSMQSWVDSPLPSPQGGSMHAQISEVLTSGHHASLPTKVDAGAQSASVPAFQSQEAKRRRRRESHNMVERRRRDNINERIHDLSRLVPQHRLEDEKVRKHIHSNGPLSPSIAASGISPPQATSLLAGGNGRRAAGNITQGLPIEEKDKGPNKGDILNGAVGWTRDLMWILHRKFQQETELINYIRELGGDWPIEPTEEEKRMRTELVDAVERNGPNTFHYSRGPGSGLRVPKHTNVAGEPLPNPISPQSLSPAMQSGGSGSNSGGQGQPQFWINHQAGGNGGHAPFSLKEEDEYGMEI